MDNNKDSEQYIWHTVQDDKVRSSHAARAGETFSWANPPEGGHPGEDFGCRCWAETVPSKNNKQRCAAISIELQNERLQLESLKERLSKAIEKSNTSLKELKKAQAELIKLRGQRVMDTAVAGADVNIPRGIISGGIAFLSFKDAIAALEERVAEARENFENAQFEINDIPRFEAETLQNIEALQASRGSITRLAERTVLERTYNGKIYIIYCRKDFYEYKHKHYDSLTEIAREITGTLCSGPTFFSRKVKMYLL